MYKRPRQVDFSELGKDSKSSIDENNASFVTPPEIVKRRKLHETTREEFRILDESIPQDAARLKTRANMIKKGKNTIGYDEYLKKVKKENRKRIPEHPMTPDHTLDIPNRRWQGQVKAWRLALHRYDPKDLTSEFLLDQNNTNSNVTQDKKVTEEQLINKNAAKSVIKKKATIREEEMKEANEMGLQVEFQDDVAEEQDTFVDATQEHGDLFDYQATNNEDFVDFDDSDDDLL